MTKLKLDCLEGTEYTVTVSLDQDRDYVIRVFRPATETEVAMFHPAMGHAPQNAKEEIAARYIKGNSSLHALNRTVEDVIRNNNPSLVGNYAATEEEETE